MKEIDELLSRYKSICWYPSAGGDFRPLLYLSDEFYNNYSGKSDRFEKCYPKDNRIKPDLFICSDYFPHFYSRYGYRCDVEMLKDNDQWKKVKYLYNDDHYMYNDDDCKRTNIRVTNIIRFSGVVKGFEEKFADDNEVADNYGSAFLMNVMVKSKWYGSESKWWTDVLYILGENTNVAKEVLLSSGCPIETIVQVRYGEAMGGGSALKGNWIKRLFPALHTRLWIANANYVYDDSDSDYETHKEYFDQFPMSDIPQMEKIYEVDEKLWSDYYPVYWNLIKNSI